MAYNLLRVVGMLDPQLCVKHSTLWEIMMIAEQHLTMTQLEEGLDYICQSPKNNGHLALIVCRPAVGERQMLNEGELDVTVGLVGDNWQMRPSSRSEDGKAHPDMQLNIMNARAIELIAQAKERWPLAGDQLYLDMDLSKENLPAGTRLKIGTAVIEITAQPHNGCKKFVARFGLDAMKFVNSPIGKKHQLRGINAKVIQSGKIKAGDIAQKI